MEPKKPRPRGFATLTPTQRRKIASMGGRTAHEQGRAHTWSSEAAREAALKSVEVRRKKART